MISRLLISLLLLSIFNNSLISMENVSQFEVRKTGEELEEKIRTTGTDSPYTYNEGLILIKKLLRLPFLPDNIAEAI